MKWENSYKKDGKKVVGIGGSIARSSRRGAGVGGCLGKAAIEI
jgi:hypothetical protein